MSLTRRTRRQFLQASAAASAALAAPYFVPAAVLGGQGRVAPSDKIVMGSIGVGGMGRNNTSRLMDQPDVQYVAVCDVDQRHLGMAREIVNKKYGNDDCGAYADFRELVAREDIDAVMIATPDHWHALASIAAANAGKDIYCEKPLANSIGEGRAVADAVKKHGRVLQTGSHERSGSNARFACELVRNGRIGKLHTIRINLPCNDGHHQQARAVKGIPAEQPVPSELDWNFWLGHTPTAPYSEKRCHFWWRFVLAHGGGEMTDRGAHVIDLGQLGGGLDDTGPVEIEASGVRYADDLYDVFWDYKFELTYANGVKMVCTTDGPRGVRFEGSDGWVFIHVHGQKLEAEPAALLQEKIGDSEIQLGRTASHHRNFLDAVKSRQQPFADAEIGHRTASVCHLANIAMLVGRKLKWDPKSEKFLGDDEANALVTPKMRDPWKLG